MNKQQSFPKGYIERVYGKCMVLSGDDIDTDRIIPARFLKCVSFDLLGEHVFADDRNELNGKHPFDNGVNQEASILVVNENFGCGSSREHAPQALMRWGIRAIVGESFAEIFYGNCLALGIPCGVSSSKVIAGLKKAINLDSNTNWLFDLKNQIISNQEETFKISIDEGPREMLMSGRWDATSQLIEQNEALTKTYKNLPYLNNFR